MNVTFARERLHDIWDEAQPLVLKHYKEIAHFQDIELKPNKDLYMQSEDAGLVRAFTARDGGELVGYLVFFISPHHPHYMDSYWAMADVLFLNNDLRGNHIGLKFINWCDTKLKEDGAQVVAHHFKAKHDFGLALAPLGYQIMDRVYVRRLD